MLAATDLIASVSARVAHVEMARRVPDWDDRTLVVPADLPPLALLAARAYPRAALERRLRFLRAMGWYPDVAPIVVPGVDPALPPEALVDDHLAAIHGAAEITGIDPVLASVVSAFRDRRSVPDLAQLKALEEFFDHQADAVDPQWRHRWPTDMGAVTAWARIEAVTLRGDRYFGRRRPGNLWPTLTDLVWRLAERKRRRWG